MAAERAATTMERTAFVNRSLQALRPPLRYKSRISSPNRLSRKRVFTKSGEEDVYVGDGKVIKDDPKKYPSKEDAGIMQGATGGWAGGEPGLQKFIEGIEPTEIPTAANAVPESQVPKKVGTGQDKIYVGFDYKNPEDLVAMREGKSGRFIIDDASKYPGRDFFMGWLPLQGGFAGGEIGLEKFLKEGDIQIAGPDEKGRSQMSPLLIGIFVAAVATTGGLLLTNAIDLGENFSVSIDQAPLDERTKLLLELAVGVLFAAWAGSAILASLKTLREKIKSGASSLQKLAISGAFWVVVLYAAYNLAKT